METISILVEPRRLGRSRGVIASIRATLLAASVLGLSLASATAFAEPMSANTTTRADTETPARTVPMPDPADTPQPHGVVTAFIPIDPSAQPQAGDTQVQVPATATNEEIRGEYGIGMALVVIAVLMTAAVLVGLYVVVMRRSWDSHDPPISQRRN